MDPVDVERLVRDSVERFDRAERDRLLDLMTADVVHEETGTARRTRARRLPAAAAGVAGGRARRPGEVLRAVGDDEVCVLEIRGAARRTSLAVGDTTLPPSGRSIDVLFTLWVQCRDGGIVAQRHHLDVPSMLTQLGALPAAAAAV